MELDIDTVGTWVAFLLTLMVYCYLGKDIPFLYAIYRVVAYVFVGVALGYGAIMVWHSVLVPRLLLRLESGHWWYIVPLVLCLLLLTRVKRSWGNPGSVTIAYLFGVGAALSVGGAIVGTLLPQVGATFVSLAPGDYAGLAAREGNSSVTYVLNALLIVLGTTSTLLYFYFTTESRWWPLARLRSRIVHLSSGFGKVFIMFTFGALFATTAISYLTLLVDRVRFIIGTLWATLPIP